MASSKILAIISGGQTGSDQAGLRAARALGIGTGGFAPKGWRTELGPAPWLEEWGLVESQSEDYRVRTRENVELADATIIFGRRSPGSNCTEEFCRVLNKPLFWIRWESTDARFLKSRPSPYALKLFLGRNNISILNIAGNRESKNPGIGEWVEQYLIKALK